MSYLACLGRSLLLTNSRSKVKKSSSDASELDYVPERKLSQNNKTPSKPHQKCLLLAFSRTYSGKLRFTLNNWRMLKCLVTVKLVQQYFVIFLSRITAYFGAKKSELLTCEMIAIKTNSGSRNWELPMKFFTQCATCGCHIVKRLLGSSSVRQRLWRVSQNDVVFLG